jgi:methylthioribose-1-phosphate isomerase
LAHTPDLESGPPPAPGTDPAPAPAHEHDPGADLGRRRFFRQFAGELIQGAASVVGAAQVLQRVSAEAASAILDPDAPGATATDTAPALPTGFRSAFRMEGNTLLLIDQRRLPDVLIEHPCDSAAAVAHAIRQMIVRGAPAIGQSAAIGLALTAHRVRNTKPYARRATMRGAANALVNARPTAVNLRWAVDRMMARYEEIGELSEDGEAIAAGLREEAEAIVFEATTDHGRLAEFGLAALPVPVDRPLRILTHCNTGPLACGQFGTALGVVQAAHHVGREVEVWVDETRPYLQGSRLTAWELAQAGVPHTVIPDVAAGSLMRAGEVDVVLVGADRIAANGDTANKVGTYPLAVLAARHGIPFYVCAPLSSVDLDTPDGDAIPIEERAAEEVLEVRGIRIAPVGTAARNPAFDVTPAELITGVVTEEGLLTEPFEPAFRAAVQRARERWAAAPPLAATPRAATPPAAEPV